MTTPNTEQKMPPRGYKMQDCPFCGGKKLVVHALSMLDKNGFSVYCQSHRCMMVGPFRKTEKAAWNSIRIVKGKK